MLIVPDLKNTPIEIRSVNRTLANITGTEFSKLMSPCYYPKMVKYWLELKDATGLDESKIKMFYKGFTNQYITQFRVISNDITTLIILGIIYYSRIKEMETVKLFYYLLAIRFYSNLVHRNFKYCKEETWELTLQQLSQKHLYKIQNGMSNSLMYLANVELQKQFSTLSKKEMTEVELLEIVYALRHRISQSMRSFTVKYYQLDADKEGKVSTSVGDEELSNITLLVDKISSSICTYNQIDKIALIKALNTTGIIKDVGIKLIEEMSSVEYKDKIRFILILMNRIVETKEWCLDSKRSNLVRKIIADKIKINKYSIKSQILELVNEIDQQHSARNINKNQVVGFITNYLTLYVRNRNC